MDLTNKPGVNSGAREG